MEGDPGVYTQSAICQGMADLQASCRQDHEKREQAQVAEPCASFVRTSTAEQSIEQVLIRHNSIGRANGRRSGTAKASH